MEKWFKERKNRIKILNDICENYFYVFSLVMCVNIMQAGMKTGKINELFLLILSLMLKSFIYAVLFYASNLLFEKWKKAKEKDKKESEEK